MDSNDISEKISRNFSYVSKKIVSVLSKKAEMEIITKKKDSESKLREFPLSPRFRPEIPRPQTSVRPDIKRPDIKRPDIPRPDIARPESLRPENIPHPKCRISEKYENDSDSVSSDTANANTANANTANANTANANTANANTANASTSANETISANATDCSKVSMASDISAFKSPARKMIHAYSLTLKELRYLYTDEDPDKSFSFYISDNSGNITFSGYFTIPTENGLRRINLSNSLATEKDMELLFRIAAKHGLSDILYEKEKAKVKSITCGSNISTSPGNPESGKTFIRVCWSNGLRQSADSAGAATNDLVVALKVIALRIEDKNVFKFNRAVKNLAKKIC